MAVDVLMPVTVEGEDAVVTAWLVDDGARVESGQLIAEVQAEKVAEDVEAPADGVVNRRVAINQPVAQGAPICAIEPAPEVVEAAPPPSVATPGGPAATVASSPGATPASPAARRLAKELGVSLAAVTGTGPGGRVTEADVRRWATRWRPIRWRQRLSPSGWST